MPIPPRLVAFRVSNPCDEAIQVFFVTVDGDVIVIGVAPGIEATTTTADLVEVGLLLLPIAGIGTGSADVIDPCF